MKFLARMFKLLKWLIMWCVAFFICCALVLMTTPESYAGHQGEHAHKYKVTYYVISEHFKAKKFNQYSHHFIGVEYRGWSASKFRNSYYKRSYMIAYTKYWQVANHWQASLMLGGVSGYKGENSCPYICPVVSPGITYTRFQFVQPRLSIMGTALTLSFSGNF